MLSGQIRQIALTVSDVDKALAFYRDTLGLQFLFAPSGDLAFLRAGEVRLMLSTSQGAGQVGANSILYFSVADIERTYDTLLRNGVTPERARGRGLGSSHSCVSTTSARDASTVGASLKGRWTGMRITDAYG